MNKPIIIIISLILMKITRAEYEYEYKHEAILDHANQIQLKWNTTDRLIIFKLTLSGIEFIENLTIGFGMSDRGRFAEAEIILFNLDPDTKMISLNKIYLDSNGVISLENNLYSYRFLSSLILNTRIELEFERSLITCNPNDYQIEFGTVHLIYFITEKQIRNLDLFIPDKQKSGMKQVQLIKSTHYQKIDVSKDKTIEITNDNVKIPSVDTTYWCKVYKLPDEFNQKHHITAFESIITETSKGVVHHMEVFHCVSDPRNDMKQFSGACNSESKPDGLVQCRKVIAAWAMGADRFVYPQNVGGVIGGDNYSPYLVLEIHYDNPNLRNDIVDSSGIRIFYEKNLRKYDAGILEIGLEYNPKMAIPPKMINFHLNSYCLSECTKASLTSSITLFASQLHTHLTGKRVWTSLIRNNKMIEIINSDNHYDQMFQEIRLLAKPIKVKPGDALITQCVYQTSDRNTTTVGGYSIRDEMCVNYLHYYPLSDLEVCKSSISDSVLNAFFLKMKQYDLAPIDLKQKTMRENFNTIRWTPLTSSILSQLYDISPISFSCNSSHGRHITKAYEKNNENGVFDLIKLDNDNDQRVLEQNYAPKLTDTTGFCD